MTNVELLNQLKIDRAAETAKSGPTPKSGAKRRIILGLGVAIAGAGAAAAFVLAGHHAPAVDVAAAEAVGGAAGAGVGSLLEASGYVVARRQATVSSKVTGRVLDVYIEEGQRVVGGQVIARLESAEADAQVARAQADLAAAASSVRLAEINFEAATPRWDRSERLFGSGFLSRQGLEGAREARDTAASQVDLAKRRHNAARAEKALASQSVEDTIVRAPFAGVVTVKAAQPGEIVSPSSAGGGFTRTGIGTIVDMDSLEVQVDVAESFIHRVKVAMPVTITLNAYPDWTIPAEVIAVIPTVERAKATVTVRVALKVKDSRILPDMGAKVAFLSAPSTEGATPTANPSAVAVPSGAVRREGGQTYVYVVAEGRLERRAVRPGSVRDGMQRIDSGVRPGEAVVVGHLDDPKVGARVRITDRAPSNSEGDSQ